MISFNIHSLLLLVLLSFTQLAVADIAVIVNPSNDSELDRKVVKRIFLGQRKSFPNGVNVSPVDQLEDSLIRQIFVRRIIKMSKKSLKSYWSRQTFTGKASPPPVKKDDESVKTHVVSTPGGIGYIDQVNVDDSVRVLFTFN